MISVLKASDKEKCGSLVKVHMLRAHLTLILLASVHQRKVIFCGQSCYFPPRILVYFLFRNQDVAV